MTNYKLKTISTIEKNLLNKKSSWYAYEKSISEEYKEFFYDELLFDLARPWPLEIKDCKFYIGNGQMKKKKMMIGGHFVATVEHYQLMIIHPHFSI